MVTFVRYGPGIERPEPNFDQSFEAILHGMKKHMKASLRVEGMGRVVRDAHAKGYGLARAEVEILPGLPAECAQGIYAKPGRHEAMIRFSNGTNHTGADRFLGATTGIGLKLFGIEGKTLLEDEPDSRTFDYAMINHPVFFLNTAQAYIFVQKLFADVGAIPPPNESPEEKRAKMHRFLHDWVTGMGTLPSEQWAWEELGTFLQFVQIPWVNLLLSTYWTMGAVRHGDYVAKLRVAPVRAFADRIVLRALDPKAAEQVFRPALVTELRERPYEFDIQVQLCADLDRMPVEKLTVRWPETLSPFVTVAKLRLPQQDIGGEDNLERMDATSVSPWRVTEEHRPMGNVMRLRKEAYRQSSILRHQANHQVRKEPKNLAEVFGSGMVFSERKGRTDMAVQKTASADQQLQELRQAFADAPATGKKAFENVMGEFKTELAAHSETKAESAGRIGSRQGKVSELTVIAPFAPGGAKRLRVLLKLLAGNFPGAEKVGSVHDMRFVFLDNDTKLLFATAYDGEWDPYIDDFATKIPDYLDLIFSATVDWPGIKSPLVKDWIVKHQVPAEGWYVANPSLTAADTRRLRRVGGALDEFLDKIA